MNRTIGVYSGRSDLLAALEAACPDLQFATDGELRDAARVVVIDADQDLDNPPRKSISRIVLLEQGPPRHRRQGELHVSRTAFLAAPRSYISFASDLAEAAVHATQLEAEVGYLTQIHQLMTLADAPTVSDRIVRTVLNLLPLPPRTL